MTSDIVTIKTNIATDIHINNYDELHKRLQSDSNTKKKKKSHEHSKKSDKIFLLRLNFKTRKMKEIVT